MLEEILTSWRIGDFTPLDIVRNLLLALALALITTWTYRRTHSGFSYSRAFNVTMVGVTMTITMIMMVIGNYLALSLGLVGALSVIRFRTAIKDPKDIAYLFLCIAIGLACSVGNYVLSIMGALLINATLLALHALRFGASARPDYCLTFRLDRDQTTPKSLAEKAGARNIDLGFRSYAQIDERTGEYVYSLKLRDQSEEEIVHFFATEFPGLSNLSLIAPEAELEVS